MSVRNKPLIRFSEFDDKWEQRKLKDLCSIFTDGDWIEAKDQSETGIRLIQTGNVGITEYYDKSNNKKWVSSETFDRLHCTEVLSGDILISRLPEPAGRACIVPNIGQKMITAVDCTIARVAPDYSSKYIVQYLATQNYFNEVNQCLAGGTRQRISRGNLSDFLVPIPNSKTEQDQIGRFFQYLDNLITLHQKKYDALISVKKSMLEKMFPKGVKTTSFIRFNGFTEVWEQRKLENYIVEYKKTTTENNQYPALTSSRKGIFLQKEYFDGNQIASEYNVGYNIVPYGYFTYRHMSDDEIFHFNVNDIVENGIVSTLYPVFTTNNGMDSKYLQYQLNYGYEFYKFALLQKQGGSRTYMYLSKLMQLCLTIPNNVEEQRKISNFFVTLDHLITLHQRQLEKLKNIKKSLLEKMFI